ncbi:MAG: PIN domain-containing protein [archaeon]
MRLVVDANIAFSLLKKSSFTRRLALEHSELELLSHPKIIEELTEHSEELCFKLGVSKEKFGRIMKVLSRFVSLKKVSPQQLNRAKSLISDPEDAPYLALAFKLGIDIWSNDSHFKEQPIVRVFRTDELVKELKS